MMESATELSSRPDEEIRQILRQRKKRARTSCYPCRARKVKCDNSSPCQNCIKRGYPELCSTAQHEADQHHKKATPMAPEHIAQPDAQPMNQYQSSREGPQQSRIDRDTDATASSPMRLRNDILTEESQEQDSRAPYLGTNSMPAFLRESTSDVSLAQPALRHSAEDAVLPILGLKESRSIYPFLQEPETCLERLSADLLQALPVDREIIR